MQEEEFDLVVLSIGLGAPHGISEGMEIVLNSYGFIESDSFQNFQTTRDGVLVCGAGQEPRDIPDTVTMASAAASKASQILHAQRGSMLEHS